ncbi:MAG: class I SAM-dependent methyltransferase [Ferruginibacter sp.]
MKQDYNRDPIKTIHSKNKDISIFSIEGKNIDTAVVETFGEEWLKFKDYSDGEIKKVAKLYFDILNDDIINKNTYALDIGCGTGRWTKYISEKVGFVEAIDPSDAVIAANQLLANVDNVRITKAAVDTIPFDDETFDFAMSIGVLHHIPNTLQAMTDCVRKVKKGGYFYCYLYYNLDNRNAFFKSIFWLSNIIRLGVSRMPSKLKKATCDVLAVLLYMPFVLTSRFLSFIGLKKLAKEIPLADYADMTFFIIRNDSLDRFGTTLEQRFSKKEVVELMEKSGLKNIVVSPHTPYYHAVGQKL